MWSKDGVKPARAWNSTINESSAISCKQTNSRLSSCPALDMELTGQASHDVLKGFPPVWETVAGRRLTRWNMINHQCKLFETCRNRSEQNPGRQGRCAPQGVPWPFEHTPPRPLLLLLPPPSLQVRGVCTLRAHIQPPAILPIDRGRIGVSIHVDYLYARIQCRLTKCSGGDYLPT